ncbi:MAG: peroxiredoxin [Pyrinomonadaceae bacterium]|mgnify:CR=1 FL=1|jgi:peroxiredoxin (alkyl hydroperoxide reductase subunit C)|nr:peroxiredoxin [Blastocatellia bacterium]MCW5956660.1 peroxiredoxin [Pyrinomonadaceae bacterium]
MSATATAAELVTEKVVTFAKVGKPAPDFDLPSTKNMETLAENVKLSDYKGKWLVLLFYPLDFTFVCPTELTAFSDRIEELNGIGAEVLGISTDSVHSHRAWVKTPRDKNGIEGLAYPLASDVGGRLAAKYNILVEESNIALRGLFIINPEGVLQYSVVHDLNIGRSVDETLRVLQGLQTGGLCAADWTPGQENLKV